ncbi:MAG: hypothetical protein E7234_00060 [Lachnospiraceae bacterium]|nr:hypothetical protein [Lachnospiraceae bacterium]
MMQFIYSICASPVAAFAICWSIIISIGEMFYKSKHIDMAEEIKGALRKYSESSAKTMLMFSLIYISAILLGTMSNQIIRWIILVFCFMDIMMIFVKIAASTEYTVKKLPYRWKKFSLPIIIIDLLMLIAMGFGVVWMIKIFASFGL